MRMRHVSFKYFITTAAADDKSSEISYKKIRTAVVRLQLLKN